MLGDRLVLDAAVHPHSIFRHEDLLTKGATDGGWSLWGLGKVFRGLKKCGCEGVGLTLYVGDGRRCGGNVRCMGLSVHELGKKLLLSMLHGPARRNTGTAPDVTCRNMREAGLP